MRIRRDGVRVVKNHLSLLEDSPFFEVFEPRHLAALARHARRESFGDGDVILRENDPADTAYMLVSGKVRLSFESTAAGAALNEPAGEEVLVRTLGEPGRMLGWSAAVEPYHYRATARAIGETELLAFDRERIELLAHEDPTFGVKFMERILWVLGNRLRETRIRLVARRYEKEALAIRALIDQSSAQLDVSSPLHKIPYYLENRLTLSDAFHTLELLRVHGSELERNLAELGLDLLDSVRRELAVYQQLQTIYDHVTNAPPSADPEVVRTRCAEDFIKLFEYTKYIVEGEENLPDTPGHIFIMNHLDNHPDNALPNAFRLTMDTHFVSSVILYRKYGEAPIRVIRKANPDEYGHQRYYDRLGYIYVYSGHVDEDLARPALLAEQRRRLFLETAAAYLREGKNIVMCPEGACTVTEKSPLPFKAGAFRLAAFGKPEPLIVPIAVAHFEKKVTHTTMSAVIGKPIQLSREVPDRERDEDLFAFINAFQARFAESVRHTARLT